jgi:drug/metabolite transporter (DMT)-like permease
LNSRTMKTNTIGLCLVVVGVLMIAYTGFTFVTTEKVVDVGPIEINSKKNNLVQWSPIAGVALLIGGIVVMAAGRSRA